MKPYYQDELLTIYNADCRKVLPWLERCDLLLTDPPYGMDYQSNLRDISLKKIENDSDLTLVSELVNMAILKLWAHRHAYIFGRYDFDLTRFKGVHELIWNKDEMTAGDLTMPWGKSYEVVTFGIRVDCDSNLANSQKRGELPGRLRKKSILTYRRLAGLSLVHPTQKPVALLREFIESSSHFGELVLDPFMGSGSTLVAAKLEGRRAIGIELDESYCAAAVKRIETETTNIQLKII
jgi:DNA modification methylase